MAGVLLPRVLQRRLRAGHAARLQLAHRRAVPSRVPGRLPARRAGRARCASSSTRTVRSPAPSASWPRTGRWSPASSATCPTTPGCSAASSSPRRPASPSSSPSRTIAESKHPNAVKFVLTGEDGLMVDLVGDSTGGGMVETVTVDGFPYRTLGDAYVLLVQDPHGGPERREARAAQGRAPRRGRRADRPRRRAAGSCTRSRCPSSLISRRCATVLDGDVPVLRLALLRPVLPVVGQPDRKPQLFDTMTRWRELAAEHDMPLWEVAVQYEMDASGWPRGWVVDRMKRARAGHAAPDPRRVRRGRRRHRHRVQAGLRRPVDEARRDAGPRQRRRHGADHQVRLRRRRRHPRRRERAGADGRRGRLRLRRPQRRLRRPAA